MLLDDVFGLFSALFSLVQEATELGAQELDLLVVLLARRRLAHHGAARRRRANLLLLLVGLEVEQVGRVALPAPCSRPGI